MKNSLCTFCLFMLFITANAQDTKDIKNVVSDEICECLQSSVCLEYREIEQLGGRP